MTSEKLKSLCKVANIYGLSCFVGDAHTSSLDEALQPVDGAEGGRGPGKRRVAVSVEGFVHQRGGPGAAR